MNEFIISDELYTAIGSELKKNLILEMRRTGSIATGSLLNSLQMEVTKCADGNAVVSIAANDYITNIEEGRKPGKYAPISPLKEWIKAKGIATDDKKVTSIAFAINNKIKKEGIKPRPILEKAYTSGLPMYDTIITDVLNNDLDKYLNEALNNL